MLIGKKLGPYKLTREAGSGQMSTVYKAVDTSIGRTVAVKVQSVPPNLLPEQREALQLRMQREARTVGRISHPNVVQVFVAGVQDDLNYIAMEYLDGVTLQDRLSEGPLSTAETAGILDQVAAGLEAVHAQGVVHRDIKPSNIMILPGGVVKLTDFGVAHAADDPALTTQGMMIGSPSYMSPEQANGQPATPASDTWSLGVLLYHMLTGKSPFAGNNVPSVLYKIVHEEPEFSPLISEGVVAVLRQAMDKSPDRRYSSPAALAGAFRAALPDLTVVTYRPAPPPMPPAAPEYASHGRALLSAAHGAFTPRVPRPAVAPPEPGRSRAMWQIPAILALLALGGVVTVVSQRSWKTAPPVVSGQKAEQRTASASLPEFNPPSQPPVTAIPAQTRPTSPKPRDTPRKVARLTPKKNPVRIVAAKVTPLPPSAGTGNVDTLKPTAKVTSATKATPTAKATPTGARKLGELLPPKPGAETRVPVASPLPKATPPVTYTPQPAPSREPEPRRPEKDAKLPPPVVVPDSEENEPPLALPSEDNTPLPDATAELRDLLGVWIAVTNERDIAEQLSFYAPRLTRFYQASNVSRDAVRAEKERVFGRASRVKMNTDDLRTTFSADGRTAIMRFRKRYVVQGGPGARSGTVEQELRWRLLDEGWKIISERDLSSD